MAAAADAQASAKLGEAIVAFAVEGRFPDEDVSLLPLTTSDLSPAIQALANAKSELEAEIRTINAETKGDVDSWLTNAKAINEDKLRSSRLADDIVRQSEAPAASGKAIQDAEQLIEFLKKEVQYSRQLHEALTGIHHVNELLSEVEVARDQRRILDSLRWLEKAWPELDAIPVSKNSCRVMKLLDLRTEELQSDVHEVFDHVWNALVHVDVAGGKLSIYDKRSDEQMTLAEAVIGLQAYKEVDDRMSQLWQEIDSAIVSPRMDLERLSLPAISASENTLELDGEAGQSVDDLFADLQKVVEFLSQRLPPDLLIYLSPIMMSELIPRLVNVWLNAAVPTSLKDIDRFQAVVRSASHFCDALDTNGFSGFTELKEWVGNAPSIWLGKCRETALDAVRNNLSNGIGASKQVEKVEKQMISRSEGKTLAANGVANANDDDWGAAWGEEEDQPEDDEQADDKEGAAKEDDGADAWGWGEEGGGTDSKEADAEDAKEEEDDSAAAWGWGEEDTTDQPQPEPVKKKAKIQATPAEEESREMILKETYNISSMPEPVLELMFAILEDGAALTQSGNESSPVAAAAAGLFSLPTFALAMFRAVSPYYYSLDLGGNMFLYNDAMYLAERLADFASTWKTREDLTKRAQNMLRLDNDIKSLQNFANRAYSNEMNTQKTVIRDLLGGEQSLMQQDELESCVDSAIMRVRAMAVTWETILARSVWYQAVGSLADSISAKIISDVMDMASIGQDEAYSIAQLIVKVTELDDLFLPAATAGDTDAAIPTTAQYASTWLRLKYLSEVLQSNLNEVKFLWCDSELSLYFSVQEVVDLVEASFEANARTKETIREIREKPHPVRI